MSWDQTWEKIFQNHEWGKYPEEPIIRFVAANFYKRPSRQDVRILDLGCGPGANLWYLAREGFDTYGIDASPTAIQRAQERLAKEHLSAKLKQGDILRLEYPDLFFDAVIENECLSCNSWNGSKDIIKQIHRVLKPRGLFFSKTFATDMYLGEKQRTVAPDEYTDISDGPLCGLGLVRMIDKLKIEKLYRDLYKLLSIDKIVYTRNNGVIQVAEWIIVAEKKNV